MKKGLLVLLLVLIPLMFCFSQTQEQIEWLLNFSKKMDKEWKENRQLAESLAIKLGMPIHKVYENGSVIELQGYENGMFIYHTTDNLNAAKTISTNKVWPDALSGFLLTGNSQTLGLWESGGIPLLTHQEYNGRVIVKDGTSTVTQHASHVTGTMIAQGIDPNAKGMSFNGQIDAYNSSNDLSEISAAAAAGLRVSSHSYGAIAGWRLDGSTWQWWGNTSISQNEDYRFGFYDNTSMSWDNFLYYAPYILVCKSAGNDRLDGPSSQPVTHNHSGSGSFTCIHNLDGAPNGYDCMNDPRGIAKNTFTIGAVQDLPNGYLGSSSVSLASFSNGGPTDDGRIKPDVVANGMGLHSANNTSNTSYVSLSGTSMSTPNVSGSVGLLLELQQQLHGSTSPFRSSTLKGLIIQTADEAGQNSGPDYTFGWGLMNTHHAAQIMRLNADVGGDTIIREAILNQGNQFELQVQSNGTEPIRATLCWIDPPGTPPLVSLNPPDLMLVNDLDLRIIGPGSTTYMPWVLNPSSPSSPATTGDNFRDNVEQVHIQTPSPGTYTVRVTHKRSLTNGLQNFSLILTGISIATPASPILVSPANDSIGVYINTLFTWAHTPKALQYHIQISTDSLFTSFFLNKDSLNATTLQVNNLSGLTKYHWRVRGKNSGGYGPWSIIQNYSTAIAPPSTPILVYPEIDAVKLPSSFKFIWYTSVNAESYRIQVANNFLFTNLIVNDSTITDTTYQINNLSDGKKYYWRVNAKNTTATSNYSMYRTFITDLYAPDSLTAELLPTQYVKLNWVDRSANETKYYILRKISNGDYSLLDSLASNQTSYTDSSVLYGNTYTYRVFATNSFAVSDSSNEASITVVGVTDELTTIPEEYSLFQNYPNPFNPNTSIGYALPVESKVIIKIYNVLGQEIKTLVNDVQDAGYKSVEWNSTDNSGNYVVSGLYLVKVEFSALNNPGNTFNQVRKMLLVR